MANIFHSGRVAQLHFACSSNCYILSVPHTFKVTKTLLVDVTFCLGVA